MRTKEKRPDFTEGFTVQNLTSRVGHDTLQICQCDILWEGEPCVHFEHNEMGGPSDVTWANEEIKARFISKFEGQTYFAQSLVDQGVEEKEAYLQLSPGFVFDMIVHHRND